MEQDISMPKPRRNRKDYQAAYRQNNPDKVKQWRLTEHTKALLKAGYLVLSPEELAILTNEQRRSETDE